MINDNKKLLPGMIANVQMPLATKDSAFIVPKTAVVNSPERVFVIRQDRQNRRRRDQERFAVMRVKEVVLK